MTLGELLSLLRRSILNDRTDRISGSSDYLWGDETLVTYINEAQRRFARKGLVLRDGTTDEVTKIVLETGRTIYPLHESVIAVMSARREDQEADLNRVGHSLFGAQRTTSENWTDPAGYIGLPPGVTLAYSTDEAVSDADSDSLTQVMLRIYPRPRAEEAGAVLRLRVVRNPINRLSVTAPGANLEIPEDHHIEILDWAAYLALRIVDDDAGAPKRAEEFRAMFEDNVKGARKLAMQKMFAPQGWGFGRGGFSWSS